MYRRSNGYKIAIPQNARHSNTLVHSLPLSVIGATIALGICNTMSQMKSMVANKILMTLGLKRMKIARPEAINATPAKYVQKSGPGIQRGTRSLTKPAYKKWSMPKIISIMPKKYLP